ncbi:MAG: hypothetical protein KAT35_00175 [Candidatus Aenigmarchaeota archaeon]|nr:hypothetical protein [Candidatus Aenigmarchaeota archaeon]
MSRRDDFLDGFERIWPDWKGDMEKYIRYVEETRIPMFNKGNYMITASGSLIKAEFYNGESAERFEWPIPEKTESQEAGK